MSVCRFWSGERQVQGVCVEGLGVVSCQMRVPSECLKPSPLGNGRAGRRRT